MDIKSIEFKSIPEIWEKEKKGLKPNTIRKVDLEDERFTILRDIAQNYIKYNVDIEIKNTETKEKFERQIKDVTFWNGFVIISWRA